VKTLYRSFAAGEITPELYGRVDLTKYQTGLSRCLNFTILPHGPLLAGRALATQSRRATPRAPCD
jgi:hypothetical protein